MHYYIKIYKVKLNFYSSIDNNCIFIVNFKANNCITILKFNEEQMH